MTTVLKQRLLTASLALLLGGAFAAPLSAQTPAPQSGAPGKHHLGKRPGMMFLVLKNYLDLTPTQETQITDLLKQTRAQALKEREFANGDKKMLRQFKRERFEKTMGQIRALLTPEQTQKLDKVKNELVQRRAERPA